MKHTQTVSRREFIGKAATITAIGFAAPALLAGAKPAPAAARPGPNSRIHVGLIGCGSMGQANLANCAKHPDVVVTAACDVIERTFIADRINSVAST